MVVKKHMVNDIEWNINTDLHMFVITNYKLNEYGFRKI